MEPLDALWDCLRQVRHLRFVAESLRTTGWNGRASGDVVLEAPSETELLFTESGIWQPLSGTPSRFHNVYRWTAVGPARVRLEHLRFGRDHPVYLFDLMPSEEGVWVSVSPHLCQDDCYSAELRLEEQGLSLRWTIAGPKKQETIEYEYTWSTPEGPSASAPLE
jgi:hypothetical protein